MAANEMETKIATLLDEIGTGIIENELTKEKYIELRGKQK